jgi:V/A-type H+-transporting ATPase subunit K
MRLFQNFSFWNSYLEFSGKSGYSAAFPRAWDKTNRVWNKLKLEELYMKRVVMVLMLVLFAAIAPVFAQEAAEGAEVLEAAGGTPVWKYFAAALAVGISCIAGGIAVGQIGSAAMGAMSENPELAGKAIPYVGLAEGICLWGFLVGLLIIFF